jgi:hypothetical protein
MRINRAGGNRESLVESFIGTMQSYIAGSPGTPEAADYFQKQSLSTKADFEKVFGTAEEFMARYKDFDTRYGAALQEHLDSGKTNRVLADMTRQRKVIDLNQLVKDPQQALSEMFKSKVLGLNNLFSEFGLPSNELPSSNAYRALFKYDIGYEDGIVHPAQILLSRLNFNFNPEKSGLESINVGNKMYGYEALSNLWDRFSRGGASTLAQQIDPMSGLLEGQKVLTFDVETTGIFDNSQVRSFAAAEMTYENGVLTTPTNVINANFRNDQLNGINVKSLNGVVQDFNAFISGLESSPTKEMGAGGQNFLDEFVKLTDKMLDADRIVAHNGLFDLDMLARTAMAQDGFSSHKTGGGRGKTAQEALQMLNQRLGEKDYFIDTLESTRIFLADQARQLVDSSAPLEQRSAAFVRGLLSEEVATNVKLGGAVKYAGVGEFAMSTNIFELIEQSEGQDVVENLFRDIYSGTHMADTDVHLQSYIAKYMHEKAETGELKLRALDDRGSSQLGDLLRARILKSSAVTPTTNVASVSHLSDTAFNYLMQDDRGLQGVSMRVTLNEARGLGLIGTDEQILGTDALARLARQQPRPGTSPLNIGDMRGTLEYRDRGFVFATAEGKFELSDTGSVNSFIRGKLNEALQGEQQTTLRVKSRDVVAARNLADESFIDFGFNFGTMSQTEDLVSIGHAVNNTVHSAGPPNIEQITKALGSTRERLGVGLNVKDQVSSILGRGRPVTSFSGGLKQMSAEDSLRVAGELAQDFEAIGDPYARFIDRRSRIVSSLLSEATSGIAERAAKSAQAAGISAEATAHLGYSKTFSELGISHFRAQDQLRVFTEATSDKLVSSRVMVMPEIIQDIISSSQAGSALEGAEISVGLSKATLPNAGGIRLNAVWNIGEDMGDNSARELAQGIFDRLVEGNTKMASILGVKEADLSQSIIDQIAQAQQIKNAGNSATAIDNLTTFIKSRGVGIGYIDGKDAALADKYMADVGVQLDNDVLNGARAFVEETNYGLSKDVKFGERTIALGPMFNPESVAQAGLEGEFKAARTVDNGVSAGVRAQQNLANVIESAGAREQVQTAVARKSGNLEDNALRTFYMANKKKIGLAGLGMLAAGAGYYMFKKRQENALYNETLEQQPYEKPRTVNGMNDSANSFNSRDPVMSDPLATSGVVSGLDRQKIGHTRMGNNKYNHLYGG